MEKEEPDLPSHLKQPKQKRLNLGNIAFKDSEHQATRDSNPRVTEKK